MKSSYSVVLAGLVLGCTSIAHPVPAQAQKLRDTGFCHLANTAAQKVIYNGPCKITQEAKDYGAVISIRMGNADPMLFGCQKNGTCMKGPTEVRMRDRGNGEASFRWNEGGNAFRLDVEAD